MTRSDPRFQSGRISAPLIALIGAAAVLAAAAVLWSRSAADPLEQQAEQFVELALSVGIGYPDEIDAWFGPAALDPREPGKTAVPPAEILAEARELLADTSALAAATPSARSARLQQRLEKFVVLLETLVTPKALAFADEAFKLYNITLPPLQSAESHQALLDGDRLELLQPLKVDPKVARRERFVRQGAKSAGLFAKTQPGGKAGY